jgi:hypothetical protein
MTDFAGAQNIAYDVVLRTQNPSIAALQARMNLGYSAATALISQLQKERVILCSWPERQPGIHPDHRRVNVQEIHGDRRLNYIERVVHLALFYFELTEEDTDGHSELVRSTLPASRLNWSEVQTLFRNDWYGSQRLSLTDAALIFHRWLLDQGATPETLGGVEAGIRGGCLPYERLFEPVSDPQVCLDRAYVRLARFYRRMLREDITRDSRAAEWFVSNSLVPQNNGSRGQHPEHVVPCAVLRDIAIECFADQWSVHQVAALLRSWLVVIWIDKTQSELLDHGENSLRDRMPADWNPTTGCLYARLHDKGIQFSPASGYPCQCSEDDSLATPRTELLVKL